MGQLPAGTITLLFSDIEGSTLLLNRLGAQWAGALSAQRSILRSSFAAHDGHEMGTEGDSFFVVFATAHAALAAALEGQRRLRAHDWPAGVPVRVRMGFHTGEPQRHEDGYIGLDVHRAARIAATAHGGQIVVSEAAKLMLTGLGDDVVVRDLGWHRLKDIEEPEHLFDVVDGGAERMSVFPPLRSLGTRANLPLPKTPLIGREGELAELIGRFDTDDARLVTLTGPGGTGKTRLALAVASALEHVFSHGIFFVDLHTADREPLMWVAIAEAVGVTGEVEESPRERVLGVLSDRRVLLVLDNLEQIDGADVVIDQLLVQAPGVSVLATSRRTMHLISEYEHPVPPLETPPEGHHTPETVKGCGAVQLFARRAVMAHPHFALTAENAADVVELCHRLDGLPLAIELAAARSRLLSPRAMVKRIDERLGLGVAASDRTPRQRSLGDTIGWSYDLLDPSLQEVFRRLGVFATGCDLTAVEHVALFDGGDPFDQVARLVDVSLLQIVDSPDGEPRVSMLQTVRSFARDRLDASSEAEHIHLLHIHWCLAVAQEKAELLHGSRRIAALDGMDAVEDNVRAALDWCLRPAGEVSGERFEAGLKLLAVMWTYWYQFGYLAEVRGWYERAAAAVGTMESPEVVDALHGLAIMMLQQNELAPARQMLARALDMAARLGDRDRQARESNSLGVAHRESGHPAEARELIEHSLVLARDLGNSSREAVALTNMVIVLIDDGDYQAAAAAAQEAVQGDMARDDTWGVAINNTNLALALLYAEGAHTSFEHLVAIAHDVISVGDPELTITIVELFAAALAELGDARLVGQLLGAADAQRKVVGIPRSGPDAVQLDRSVTPAMQALPPVEWESAHTAGRSITIGEAVERALGARETSA